MCPKLLNRKTLYRFYEYTRFHFQSLGNSTYVGDVCTQLCFASPMNTLDRFFEYFRFHLPRLGISTHSGDVCKRIRFESMQLKSCGCVFTFEDDRISVDLDDESQALHSLGVRNLVFIGLGPLGCIPLQRVTTSDGGCRQNLNSWSLKFNSASNNLIKDLNSKLPAAQFKFADGYSFFNDIIQNPKNYGFEVSDTPCCTLGRYRPTLSCVPAAKLCSNRSKYVFWDEYHPSDAANHIIASALMAAMDLKPGASSPPPSASPPSTGFSPSPSPSS